ncbi:MAG TPA: carbon monoxide dehydrogenase subunit G [Casimicrobiaceae bacterium]|nr:carbon monoxide dehydrogenase subunit G [Casimicrobiaceae bacterium]
MTSSRTVPASVEKTWAALNDPETLKACIPGCESIERVSDTEFRVAMTARVGPVSAKFSGRIILSDIVPPTSYKLGFEGQGGAAGFARGDAKVALTPDGSGTRIEYNVNAQVGGKLAQIGSRLVDGAAAKIADDFFACFVERLGGGAAAVAEPVVGPAETATTSRTLWLRLAVAAAIIVAIFIYWLTRPA